MSWIVVGESAISIDSIERVERVNPRLLHVYMRSGDLIEMTESMAVTFWNYIVSERIPFYDTVTPTRDFSGT